MKIYVFTHELVWQRLWARGVPPYGWGILEPWKVQKCCDRTMMLLTPQQAHRDGAGFELFWRICHLLHGAISDMRMLFSSAIEMYTLWLWIQDVRLFRTGSSTADYASNQLLPHACHKLLVFFDVHEHEEMLMPRKIVKRLQQQPLRRVHFAKIWR